MMAASLFMAFGKRRGEVVNTCVASITRRVLIQYDLPFLNGIIFVIAGLAIAFYALWASASVMIYTVPIVVFFVCRYLLIINKETSHGDPISVILGDYGLLVAALVFLCASVILLYLLT
jgi:hypothetical protein